MAYMPTVRVSIDDVDFEVQLAQGDYVRAEAQGFRFSEDENPGSPGFATVVWHALLRAKRKGLIAEDLPASYDDFLDGLSFPDPDPVEETDPKGSSQEQATG